MTGFDRGMFAVGRSGVQRDLTMAALFMFQDAGTHARSCVRACVLVHPHTHIGTCIHIHVVARARARSDLERRERVA